MQLVRISYEEGPDMEGRRKLSDWCRLMILVLTLSVTSLLVRLFRSPQNSAAASCMMKTDSYSSTIRQIRNAMPYVQERYQQLAKCRVNHSYVNLIPNNQHHYSLQRRETACVGWKTPTKHSDPNSDPARSLLALCSQSAGADAQPQFSGSARALFFAPRLRRRRSG